VAPVLEFDALTLATPTGVPLLRDFTLSLGLGETVGLVGESGAGKSMVGRMISGLVPPGFRITSGRVLFDGKDLAQVDRRRLLGGEIGFIPQEPLSALNPVVSIGRQFASHLRGARTADLVAWLDAVHLPEPDKMLRRYPHELSGGQCQRVLIAMAFSRAPRLIVADEPTTALDVITQARILALLKEQQARHRTAILLITHDLHLAADVCDRVGVLYVGDLVERGPARAVLRTPLHPYTVALRDSVPNLEGPRRVLPQLPEQMPGLRGVAGLDGCRFAPRCPADACGPALPPWRMAEPEHDVRCASACERTAHAAPALPCSILARGESSAVLDMNGVSLTYGKTEAVRNVSLSVRAGEFVGLVGESGSGKSSVARLVMGLEKPTSGDIILDRTDAQFIFQNPQSALNPRRTIHSLVTQATEAPGRRLRRADRGERARLMLQETRLPIDCLWRVPSQLSGGQKQRVNIARALCVTPRLLIADEITSGLDVSVQAQILNLLLQIGRDHGIAVLLISHDLAVVRYLCSRVAVMQRGVIVETGATDEVFENPNHPYTKQLLAAVPGRISGAAA
jgi:peptide/nickel transport system ATP-binding protein